MGIAKHWQMEMDERGYDDSCAGKNVCINCFNEEGIQNYINEHGELSKCSYCVDSKKIICLDLSALMGHIMDCIKLKWDDSNNAGVSWESREGGWQGAIIYDKCDLLDTVGINANYEALIEDIVNSIDEDQWCKVSPYSLREHETLYYGWKAFSKFIKYHSRYFFMEVKNELYGEYQHDEINPIKILDELRQIINKQKLIKPLDTDSAIYRVRVCNANEKLSLVSEIGSTTKEKAKYANRMSPPGIVMFYGAFDIDTAIQETYEPRKEKQNVYYGVFKPVRKLNIIDLANIEKIPSFFDEHKNHIRDEMIFINDFLQDFSKSVEKDGREHINYVPTQVFTEYIKNKVLTKKGKRIDGIVYQSSKSAGKSIVIFADSEQCIDDNFDENKNQNYNQKEPLLRLENEPKQIDVKNEHIL